MYGYQPPAARRLAQTTEQYADGGLVARMKSADAGPAAFGSRGLSQLRDMVPQMAAMGYPQQAAAPAPAPAPVSDPRVAQLQAMIPQMEAMGYQKRPLTPQMLARGGMVRGPGTGTSDSIPDEAEPGTFIMPADSTAAIGPDALEKLGTMPVRLSDGEFKIPPEQVMAIGEAVLKLMKDATHTPVNGEDGGQTDAEVDDDDDARGFNPADRMAQMPQMYADGGSVGFQRMDIGQWAQDQEQGRDDLARFEARQAVARQEQADADEYARQQAEQAKRMAEQPAPAAGMYADGGLVDNNVTRVGNSYSGGNVGGAITVNGAAPSGTFNENPGGRTAPVPAPQPDPSIVSMIRPTPSPAPSAAPVAASPSTAAAQPMGWAERNAQRNAEVSAASITNRPEWSKTATSRPAGLGAPPPVPSIAPPAPVPSLSSFGYQPRRYADGGMVEDDLQKRLMQIPSSAPPGWNGGGGGSGGGGGAGGVTGSWEAPQAAPAPAPAQPAGALTRAASMSAPAPAVQAMGTLPLNPNGGQVSTQSMGAADGLARRGAADALAQMPSAPAPVQAPTVLTSENSWQKRNDLRNALVSASSITNNGGKWDRHKGESPESLTYRAMLGTDQALQASAPGLAQAAMREQGDLQRTGLQVTAQSAQAAADRQNALERTLIGERGANARTGLTTQTTLEAAKIKAQQELAEQQRKAALKNPEISTALRKEFEGLPEVKNYKQALPAYKGIEDAVTRNTPMSDINIVYGIAKLYDPNSVVREGEYATVANAPNIPERVKGWVQYATNGGKLTPEVKKQIMDEASSRMMSFQNEFEGSSARYRDIAERSNADPTLVISSDYKPAVAKKEEQAVSPQIAELQRRAASNPALAARLKEMGY